MIFATGSFLNGKMQQGEDGQERCPCKRTGKKLYAFATSGGNGIGKSAEKLKPYLKGVEEVDGKLVRSAKELSDWK